MVKFLAPLVMLLSLCAQGADTQPPATNKVPAIALVGKDTTELGTINGYGKQTVSYRFKNTGEAPGEILSFVPSCACISASADKMRLPPQEEAVVTVTLDASMVHGSFKRNVWVVTNDPKKPRTALILRGEARPLFLGRPASPQRVVLAEGAAWTNRFTLTQAETNLFVGTPSIKIEGDKLTAAATLTTNTQGKASFEVTLVVTALAPGGHQMYLTLPIHGRPDVSPMKLTYFFRVGSKSLRAIPSRVVLAPTEQPLTRKLHIKTVEKDVATNALSWTPELKGVSVQVQPSSKESHLLITLTLSPEAVTNLLAETDAEITFNYPGHAPVSADFITLK